MKLGSRLFKRVVIGTRDLKKIQDKLRNQIWSNLQDPQGYYARRHEIWDLLRLTKDQSYYQAYLRNKL